MFAGVLERYPKLKIVSVENEIGWIPFWLGQCDKAFKRHRHSEKVPMSKLPSEYFAEQIYATFFNDHVGGKMFSWWGVGQLHVVQRLPAPEFDLAAFARRDRA